jgi:bifunctional non-homologous end joining protein LigD
MFDLLWLNGQDLRERSLIERKRMLRAVVPERSSALLYAGHIAQHGVELFRLACERDLEGVVAKAARLVRAVVVEYPEPGVFTIRGKA